MNAMPPRAFSARQARRLRRLVEQRLRAFEELAEASGDELSAAGLERQSKALIALMKALETAAGMEAAAIPARKASPKRDDAIRRSLAKGLEALLAENAPPEPVGETDGG